MNLLCAGPQLPAVVSRDSGSAKTASEAVKMLSAGIAGLKLFSHLHQFDLDPKQPHDLVPPTLDSGDRGVANIIDEMRLPSSFARQRLCFPL